MANPQNNTPPTGERHDEDTTGDLIVGVAGGVAGAAVVPVAAPAVLGLVGFGGSGPIAGSLAAIIQSSIGSVVAGSPFAIAQSIAMGGAVPLVGFVIGGAIAAGAAVTAVRMLRGGPHDNNSDLNGPGDDDPQDGPGGDSEDDDPPEKSGDGEKVKEKTRDDIKTRLNRLVKAD
ncbi:hypothetical protein BDZ94DRAFT_1267483 [Collybia nuda]|uniref:Uncharacterized protein n=1 Tax=Collybia nuda TaxID=64659 RepID=A0A9P5XY05_9AGAR|nr:hypothetical protein BDZ94DRAFT_1267483 [Collybia nuda]